MISRHLLSVCLVLFFFAVPSSPDSVITLALASSSSSSSSSVNLRRPPKQHKTEFHGLPRSSSISKFNGNSKNYLTDDLTIFMAVAAFRDVECVITVDEIYKKANNPRRIFLGIIEQNEHGDPTCIPPDFYQCTSAEFCPIDNIRRRLVVSKKAKGPCYGRYISSLMYRGENFYMMIDSHNLFLRNWDRKSILQLWRARSSRPVLSHYPSIWDKSGITNESPGNVMVQCNGHYLPNLGYIRMDAAWFDRRMEPFIQPFTAAGYMFGDSRFNVEVPWDRHLNYLFDGEEILSSVRLWTHGFDLFTPGESLINHDYARHTAKRYWHVPGSQWGYEIVHAQHRVQYFLRVRKPNSSDFLIPSNTKDRRVTIEEEKYGLGKERKLEEYEKFARIDPVKRVSNFGFCQRFQDRPRYDI